MTKADQISEVAKHLQDIIQSQLGGSRVITVHELIDCAFLDFQKAYDVANNCTCASDYDSDRVKALVYEKVPEQKMPKKLSETRQTAFAKMRAFRSFMMVYFPCSMDFDLFCTILKPNELRPATDYEWLIEVTAAGEKFVKALAVRCDLKLQFDVSKEPTIAISEPLSLDSTSSESSEDSDETTADEDDCESSGDQLVSTKLTALGFLVFDRKSNACLTWDSLAGYERVKRQIADTVVNVMKYPDVYERVMKATRMVPEPNRPKAVLFEGPPGTGKTLTARILASQCDRPLVVVALENIMTKWFGEAEKKLAKVFDQCAKYTNGAIIFIDEIDALAPSRDRASGSCGVSERILSVLLQKIEGFSGKGKSLLVAATNRKHDLDAALVSRFDLMIPYPLPDAATRSAVFRRYAKQFDASATTTTAAPTSAATDLANQSVNVYDMLGSESAGFSCRAIKEVCEQAERTAAGRLVSAMVERDNNSKLSPPSETIVDLVSGMVSAAPLLSDYLECIKYHRDSLN